MAIYHASTKPIARSAGRSAVAAAAYRAACELVDERTGRQHDYTRKGGVVCTEILLPDGGSAERNALWNGAEAAEKRKDARTAREWIVALPAELDADQRRDLACGFGAALATRYGVAVDVAIHLPDREGDHRNHHAHLLTTTRQVGRAPDGSPVFGEKAVIELSDKARRARGLGAAAEEVTAIRQLWEQMANRALERAGRAERIDARSLEAQGIDREATTHLGPAASEMERRGVPSDRGDGNRQAAANNRERAELRAEVFDLNELRHLRARAEREHARKAEEAAQKAAQAAELERIKRMTAAEVGREIARRRPPPVSALVEQDPDVAEAVRKCQALAEQCQKAKAREDAAKAAALDWRQDHPWRARLHDAGLLPARFLTEQKALEAGGRQAWLLAMPRHLDAEQREQTARTLAELRISAEQAPARAIVAELERIQQAKSVLEQRERREAAERAQRAREFAGMAASRAMKAHGYRDDSEAWKATPKPLRDLIDAYNREPKAMQQAIIERMQRDPAAARPLAEFMAQRRENERQQDRGRGR